MVIDDLRFNPTTKAIWLTIWACIAMHYSASSTAQGASPLAPNLPTAAPAAAESPNNAEVYKTSAVIPAAPPVVSPQISPAATDNTIIYEQDEDSKRIGQAISQATTNAQPTDLAPVKLPERTTALSHFDEFKTSALYKLPSRMFLAATCENSIRLETNVYQTLRNHRSDLIYRPLPNATIGYALTKTTRISHNYFYFRDQYAHNNRNLSRNIHSIGFRIDQDLLLSRRTTATVSFFTRQLLLSRTQPLSDLLPSISVVRRVGDRGAVYASVLGQIRFRNTLGRFQEGDQFYSLGGVYRTPRWTFLADHTLITNFGNRQLRGGPDNSIIILTYEAAYKIHPVLPVSAFVRAEPIFNMGANQAIGFAGFNFRIFGGLRVEVAKPPIFPVKIKRQ